ncbi:MAG: DNA repair protein RadA [Deltaproteobacteria bacterium CG11_big_fil_rev_8_21_14_0_20_45_16]|nr:MAG: DNA repair protein RadA [Deltaproteobacteria bacterium CG11_big_fil_rev_8_21_14_0_20_45_16]
MAKLKTQTAFACESCGTAYSKWQGQCESCGSWNTVVSRQEKIEKLGNSRLLRLSEVEVSDDYHRQSTGLDFLDRILGGGLPRGATILLAGQPGTGKSTLLFQLFGTSKQKCLYVSAEESAQQVASRFRKQTKNPASDFFLHTENQLSEILRTIDKLKPDLVAIDSIQMIVGESLDRMKGGSASIREVSEALVAKAKAMNFTLWIVGHVTKDGEIAGPKTLEHLVDSVILFSEGEESQVRILQTQKHRFGISGELAILEMSSQGLSERPGAESYWMQDHAVDLPGCAFGAALFGSRVYCVEIQALCSDTHFPSPRRSANGFDINRLYLLLAVLEKRLKFAFSHQDVYLNVVGGLKLTDPAVDLAVAAALVSAQTEKPTDRRSVFVGELGLTGEIRMVPSLAQRLRACEQVGRARFICPVSKKLEAPDSVELLQYRELKEALKDLLP